MKYLRIALAIVLLPLCVVLGDEQKSSVLMRAKLQHTEGILEGLTKADFELIEKNAKVLNTFGAMEQWFRSGLPQYDTQLRVFRLANQDLIREAQAKNLDGASLAYVQLTLSCVNCHKVVRDHAH